MQHVLGGLQWTDTLVHSTTQKLSLEQYSDILDEPKKEKNSFAKPPGPYAQYLPKFGELKFDDQFVINPMRKTTGMWRVQCAWDTQMKEVYWYHKEVEKEYQEKMTPWVCFHFCKNIVGVQFLGLRNGDKCYCTPFFSDTNKGGHGGCDMPCVGDPSFTCGGKAHQDIPEMAMTDIYQMHDPNNLPAVPCQKPPRPVLHAKLFSSRFYRNAQIPCSNAVTEALTTFNQLCTVECEDGYEIFENHLKCEERGDPLTYSWAQMVGAATCTPVVCGVPPKVLHTKFPHTSVLFPEKVQYTCDVGYTLNSTAQGKKAFSVQCQADRSFSDSSDCLPVSCGNCPRSSDAEKYAHSNPVEDGERVYQQSCHYVCESGYTLDQQAAGRARYNTVCLATGEFTEPHACLPVSCGAPPRYPFTHLEGPEERVPQGADVVFPQVTNYKCDTGYTFNQVASGPTEFNTECQASGIFTSPQECQPVLCGAPVPVEFSSYNNRPLVYLENVAYRCDYGYTLTGVAGERAQKVIMCGDDGQFVEDAPTCQPVLCGEPPAVPNGQLMEVSTSATIHFASEPLVYTCDPGYSTDSRDAAWEPFASNSFEFVCQADGTFETPSACVNINDCAYVACGLNGQCEDLQSPTGVHLDDYTCNCDSGYEITLHESTLQEGEETKKCTNINDCPLPLNENCGGINAASFRRGTCSDLINDYACNCRAGYEVTMKSDAPENKTCTPRICGLVPEIVHAATDGAGEATFDTPPWEYTCEDGYSLNGQASGEKVFSMRCKAAASFTTAKICKPVTCGSPPVIRFSDMSPQIAELFYPDVLTFTCESGYSTTGKIDGPKEFEVRSQADGTQSAPETCMPVECGNVPDHVHASWDSEKIVVFKESARIECAAGYSLDTSMSPAAKFYSLHCQSDGTFSESKTCKNVKAGEPPKVSKANRPDGNLYYLDNVKYTLSKGFTLDARPDGVKEFQIEALDDASFSNTQEPKPVSCGAAPEREKATTHAASYTYLQKSLYTCLEGYSTDSVASGPKTFELECQADGNYEGLPGCLPVECGSVEVPEHTEQVEDDAGGVLASLVFGQHATFQCLPGWSTDGILGSNMLRGNVVCQADGSLSYPPECVNQDDCASPENSCAPDGECKDTDSPTGEHVEDFKCECHSGFAHNVSEAGVHYCYNVPDCPDGGCEPGSCEDLINDYECHCPEGYYQDANEQEGLPHDCLPNLCGRPNVVEHASTPDSDRDFYFDDNAVEYTCDVGYTLDGSASGETVFQLACKADTSFEEAPECKPVQCGSVPNVQHAAYPLGTMLFFPETVSYECEEGYSTDQTYMAAFLQVSPGHEKARHLHWAKSSVEKVSQAGDQSTKGIPVLHSLAGSRSHSTKSLSHTHSARVENTEFSSECKDDGTFTETKQCLPIKCDSVPSQQHVITNHEGAGLVFPQDLSSECLAGYALNENSHAEKTYTIKCAANGELEVSYAELGSSTGCTAIKCGELPAPANAQLTGSPLFGEIVAVTCDQGHSVTRSCAEPDSRYKFTCQANGEFAEHPNCERVKCALPMTLEHASFSAGDYFFGDKVRYSAEEGYTLNGHASGMRSFEMTCEHDCKYSGKQVFKPVECGAPPDLPKTTHPGVERVFSKIEPYTCKGGHSVDGTANGAKSFTKTCQASGEYDGPQGCEPVQCGAVVVPPNCEHLGPTPELVFQDPAFFDCNPGFSMGGRPGGGTDFMTVCMADGQQSHHDGCKNKNDCEGNKCGPNGRCVDHEEPTGRHLDDYHCECDSGFEEEEQDGFKICGNVPDCPEGACLPGSCEDLVNDYRCHCPEGYFVGENAAEDLAHDCLPEPCGAPPTVEHATTASEGQDTFFNSDPVQYECAEGYTLDAAATGDRTFEINCKADGAFEAHPTCLPVGCGEAHHVDYATYQTGNVVFPNHVQYTCEEGYTTTGTAAGATSFEGSCEATGELAGVLSCEPVACAEVPEQANAEYNEGSSLVFPQVLAITCHEGFALDENSHGEVSYTISCASSGELTFSNSAGCSAINCGALPVVEHAEVQGSSHFGEEATVRCSEGHSTDQTAFEGSAEYTISCQSNGQFTHAQECQPVNCGLPLAVDFTTRSSEDAKVFGDVVTYQLVPGYSLSGEFGGATDFSISCQADASFTALEMPLPVLCGAPPSKTHASAHGESFVFPEQAPYTCAAGYSLNGHEDGDRAFSLSCAASGEYEGPSGCQPISCGDVTRPDHTSQVEDHDGRELTSLVFPEIAKFVCEPGYSKTGELGSQLTTIVVTCQADGSLLYPAQCVNNNDCLSPDNACSPNGQCADNETPTGSHLDDFHCECDSGFTQAIKEGGIKWCKNIPDCPEGACAPGGCADLVNDYECHCPLGYYQGENTEEGLSRDCLPQECGNPPAVPHASATTSTSVFYDSQPVAYSCGDGYTLDGVAAGEKVFSVACMDSGSFADVPVCEPVSCGEPPEIPSARPSTRNQLVFEETVTYECAEGYSTDGSVDANRRSFVATCSAEGAFAEMLACERIRCGEGVPSREHAVVVEDGEHLVFEEVATVTCIRGYALSAHDRTHNTYNITCTNSGALDIPDVACEPIDCASDEHAAALPEVANAEVTGSSLFGGSLSVVAVQGYSLDGSADGVTEFSISCDASGSFTPEELPTFSRIGCNFALYSHVSSVELIAPPAFIELPKTSHSSAHVTIHHIQSQRGSVNSLRNRQNPEPRFDDELVYTCTPGHRVSSTSTATISAPESFSLKCGAQGDMVNHEAPDEAVSCAPVVCAIPAAPGVDFVLQSGHDCQGSEADLLVDFEGSISECMQECRTLAGCVGFVRLQGSPDHPATCVFRGGTLGTPSSATDGRDCYEHNSEMLHIPQMVSVESLPGTRIFEQSQEFQCIPGYTLDGTPTGETDFEETCTETGEMSTSHECLDIDFCQNSQCGDNGECKDDLLQYHCDCEDGFELAFIDGTEETCVQIDECNTLSGDDVCEGGAMMGVCVDETLGYHCECSDGYENSAAGELGLDSCIAKTCEETPAVDNASPTNLPKLTFRDTLVYTCHTGYSLDGSVSGAISFSAECTADTTISGVQACQPVSCGSTAMVERTTVDKTTLVFPEEAEYTCEVGYTLTGTATGTDSFTTSCTSEGIITDPMECKPISCGKPPFVPFTSAPADPLTFDMEATYTCKEGYTLTGEAGGETEFRSKCESDGEFSGIDGGVSGKCQPVKCGVPPRVRRAEMPLKEFKFPSQFEVVCHSGYTVDRDPDGESTFVAKCEADGTFSGMQDCLEVTCGSPHPTDAASSTDGDKHYKETAEWVCNAGFSIDGTPMGSTAFVKECQATGSYGASSPADCIDIDYCHGEPCTANGRCIDAGEGVPAPGYSCECFEGFEVVTRENGGEKCSEDDCAGSPCGPGGTCTDMSQQGGDAGTYSCECDAGFDLVEHEPGHPVCERIECGAVAPLSYISETLGGTPEVRIVTFAGNEPEMSVLYGTAILQSFDQVTYECREGYSTDGTTHVESKTFRVICEGSGLFNPPLTPDAEYCVPIQCDNTFIPEISQTHVPNPQGTYVFGDSVHFECNEGHTIGGEVGASSSFALTCESSGRFSDENPICLPVTCPVPAYANSAASAIGSVEYGQAVTWNCDMGFYLGGAVSESTMFFGGECGANGELDMTTPNPECLPASCGAPALGSNSVALIPGPGFFELLQSKPSNVQSAHHGLVAAKHQVHRRGGHAISGRTLRQDPEFTMLGIDETLTFGEIVMVVCADGYTIGGVSGGPMYYETVCGPQGNFLTGMPTEGPCEAPRMSVSGEVVDAQNGYNKLGDVQISFIQGDQTVASATTSNRGLYSVQLPAGAYLARATKNQWVTVEKNITIAGTVRRGQGADIALSAVLPADGWRVVLSWGAHSRDLDSWTYFDRNFGSYVYYGRPRRAGRSSGVSVQLDWDDVDGYGPETTTFRGVGSCTTACLIKFHVDNYSIRDGPMGSSEAYVTLYHADAIHGRYSIPESAGNARGYTVFTLDAATEEVYDGDWGLGPKIINSRRTSGSVNRWSMSMDTVGWSRVPAGTVLYAITANGLDNLHQVRAGFYHKVNNVPGGAMPTIEEVEWPGLLASGEPALCPDGTWLSGLYRDGSRYDPSSKGGHQITMGECSRFAGVDHWGDCSEIDMFEAPGNNAAKCPDINGEASALVGLYHHGHPPGDRLADLYKGKCCAMPLSLSPVPQDIWCTETQSCNWNTGWGGLRRR